MTLHHFLLFSYDRSVEKRIVGTRMLSKLKIKKYDVANCCARSRECPERSRSSHFMSMVWA